VSSLGSHAIEWAREVLGIELYPWQQEALTLMLAQRSDGKWAASRTALLVSRQSGKSLLLMVRELYAVLVLGDQEVVHSAHESISAAAAFRTTCAFLENVVSGVAPRQEFGGQGREHIVFEGKGTLRFRTRTATAGRGPSTNLIVLDEAQALTDDQMQALLPSRGARSMQGNPQLCMAGTAGNYASAVFARVRRAGIAGTDKRLLYIEHSIDDEAFWAADVDARLEMVADPAQRAMANPLYEVLVSEEYLSDELTDLGAIGFAREHMCVGSWPPDDSTDWLIPRKKWAALAVAEALPTPSGAVSLAVGAAWDRTVSIGVHFVGADGLAYGELTHYGVDSESAIVAEVVRLRDAHEPCAIVLDDGGPAGPLVAPLEAAGVDLERVSARDVAHACQGLHDAVTEVPSLFRHRGQAEVSAALAGAKRKNVGDGWVLDRRRSSSDVTPLEVLALARWGHAKYGGDGGPSAYEARGLMSL